MRTPATRCLTTPALALTLLFGACAGEEAAPTGDVGAEHVVERTTEGNVTTVRNLSGSVWGGNALLAVDLEIGIHEGDPRYMLVNPYPLFATEDEIYVVENADGRIRVYGFDGEHRRDFGKPGPGPGELGSVSNISVTEDDRVLLTHMAREGGLKVSIFTTEGEFLEEWHLAAMGAGPVGVMPGTMALTPRGMETVIMARPTSPEDMNTLRFGFQKIGKEGLIGEPWMVPESDYEPATVTIFSQGFSYERQVPFEPSRAVTTITPGGHRVWGHPHEYRFRIDHPDGSSRVVERVTAPVEIDPEEAEYEQKMFVRSVRQQNPDFDWDGSEMPATKPWYQLFVADAQNRIWVSRIGPSRRVGDCTEPEDVVQGQRWTPCWEPTRLLEAFDVEGNFLGGLDRPEGLTMFGPYIRGDIIVAGYQDELGVSKVRVYRLVTPGEATPVTEVIR